MLKALKKMFGKAEDEQPQPAPSPVAAPAQSRDADDKRPRKNKPARTAQGEWTDRARFDIVDYDDSTIALMLEGDPNRTDTGERIIWLLRLTDQPAGYCWGRADWPSVRCVSPAVRCDAEAPTS
mgnify:CR=1 FL=1